MRVDTRRMALLFVGAALTVVLLGFLFLVVFPWVDRTFVTNPVLGG
jgi:hypothetical protein